MTTQDFRIALQVAKENGQGVSLNYPMEWLKSGYASRAFCLEDDGFIHEYYFKNGRIDEAYCICSLDDDKCIAELLDGCECMTNIYIPTSRAEKRTIILSVRIEYTTEKGENEQHALTAASLVINDKCPTIDEGVRIDHVEAYLDGEQII